MKKACIVVAVLVLILVSTSAFAGKTDKQFCFIGTSDNPKVPGTSHKTILSYSDLSNGHVLFYGETCYVIPPANGSPEAVGCLPMTGSGILNEGKVELFLQGAESTTELGFHLLETFTMHVLLSMNTKTGRYANEVVDIVEGERIEVFDTGTTIAVKCPAPTQSELDSDKQFESMIKELDAMGNEDENDLAFRTMQADLQACMQPGPLGEAARIAFSEKYNVPLSEVERLVGDNSSPFWHIACEIELATIPGVIIWRIRADQDHWNYTCGQQDVGEYCYRYSDVCNHLIWAKGCLESKEGPQCFGPVDPKQQRCLNARGVCRSGCTLLSLRPECEAACDREYEHCMRYSQ